MWRAHFYAERKMKCVWCRTHFMSYAKMRMLFCRKRMNIISWVTLQGIFKRCHCGVILRDSKHLKVWAGCFAAPSVSPLSLFTIKTDQINSWGLRAHVCLEQNLQWDRKCITHKNRLALPNISIPHSKIKSITQQTYSWVETVNKMRSY